MWIRQSSRHGSVANLKTRSHPAEWWIMIAIMQPKKSGGSMRLLIIDDEESIRRTTAAVLESMGHQAVGVENGAGALKLLETDFFDIAFLHVKLNEESGLDV